MDKLDMRIAAHLQKDADATNSSIAKELGVSEETIRRRLKRLSAAGMIKTVVVPNAEELGFVSKVLIGIQVEVNMVNKVAKSLAEMPQVIRLFVTTGSFDMFAYANLKSTDNLNKFLRDEIGMIEGIRQMQTFIVLKEEKDQYGVDMQSILETTYGTSSDTPEEG